MSLRAIWKGVLVLGHHTVPVKLYTAIEPRPGVELMLLHEPDRTPLEQVLVNATTDKPVPKEYITRGFEYRRKKYVQVDADVLDELKPEPSRDIELLSFVDPEELDARYFLRSYYLGPDEDAATYAALQAALAKSARLGLCRWVMRNIAYRGALQAFAGGLLVLTTLRQPEELLAAPAKLGAQQLSAKERKTAQYLVNELAGDWQPGRYRDEYQRELRKIIAAKSKGKTIAAPRRKVIATKSGELLELLEASVKSAQGKGAANKATRKPAAAKRRNG